MSKADTERKRRYNADLHKKRDFLHVHLSKALKERLKTTKRAMLVRKGDKVKIMRGKHKGKEGKISNVDYIDVKVFIEGVMQRTGRGKETFIPFEPSNLLLLERVEKVERREREAIKKEAETAKASPVIEQKEPVKKETEVAKAAPVAERKETVKETARKETEVAKTATVSV